jgi:hypothetical protein
MMATVKDAAQRRGYSFLTSSFASLAVAVEAEDFAG